MIEKIENVKVGDLLVKKGKKYCNTLFKVVGINDQYFYLECHFDSLIHEEGELLKIRKEHKGLEHVLDQEVLMHRLNIESYFYTKESSLDIDVALYVKQDESYVIRPFVVEESNVCINDNFSCLTFETREKLEKFLEDKYGEFDDDDEFAEHILDLIRIK